MAGMLFCVHLAVRRGLGALYFRKGSPDAIQTALKWDPSNSEYYDVLATLRHMYADGENPDQIIQLYRNAVRFSPYEARWWADLASAYDWAGRSAEALACFRHAQLLFPNSPEINWRLANFYLRVGQTSDGLRTLQKVLVEDGSAQRKVFVLATHATGNSNELLKQLLPDQAPILFAYLNFEVENGDIAGSEQVWNRIAQGNLPFELHDTFPYMDFLIQHKQVDQLARVWAMLATRLPAQIRPLATASNLVTNGRFEHDILEGGLDWRVVPAEGAVVSLDSDAVFDGARALRIAFDGSRNLNYNHVLQYVLVKPGAQYRFSVRMRAQAITTDSGPRFQICDAYNTGSPLASTENLLGTSGWFEHRAEFKTSADTRLLLIRVVRPASRMLDNKISGSVWIDCVRLEAES